MEPWNVSSIHQASDSGKIKGFDPVWTTNWAGHGQNVISGNASAHTKSRRRKPKWLNSQEPSIRQVLLLRQCIAGAGIFEKNSWLSMFDFLRKRWWPRHLIWGKQFEKFNDFFQIQTFYIKGALIRSHSQQDVKNKNLASYSNTKKKSVSQQLVWAIVIVLCKMSLR